MSVISITAGSGAFEEGAKSVHSPVFAPTGVILRPTTFRASNSSPAAPVASDALPPNLAPDTLRKLADLEERKTRGEVTQTQYNALREALLRSDPSAGE